MKIPEYIYNLLLAKFAGLLDEKGEKQLEAWLQDNPSHESLYYQIVNTLLLTQWAEKRDTISKEAAWGTIKRIRHAMRRKRIVIWSSVAASLVIAIASTIWISSFSDENPEIYNLASIGPPANKVIIELSDGKRHFIEVEKAEFTEKDGTQLDVSNREITYDKAGNSKGSENKTMYNKVIIPQGAGVYKISLSDGTIVWLNTDSELEYPLDFAADRREVRLRGEAFFDVADDAKKPFIVETSNQVVTVLGTEFNIYAYPQETIQTTLVSGKVKVVCAANSEEIQLSPGQQSNLDTSSEHFLIANVNVHHFISWKSGLISLDGRKLSEILKLVSRSYNVDFELEDQEIDNLLLGGSISMGENLEVVLRVLEKIGDVKFKNDANGKRLISKL